MSARAPASLSELGLRESYIAEEDSHAGAYRSHLFPLEFLRLLPVSIGDAVWRGRQSVRNLGLWLPDPAKPTPQGDSRVAARRAETGRDARRAEDAISPQNPDLPRQPEIAVLLIPRSKVRILHGPPLWDTGMRRRAEPGFARAQPTRSSVAGGVEGAGHGGTTGSPVLRAVSSAGRAGILIPRSEAISSTEGRTLALCAVAHAGGRARMMPVSARAAERRSPCSHPGTRSGRQSRCSSRTSSPQRRSGRGSTLSPCDASCRDISTRCERCSSATEAPSRSSWAMRSWPCSESRSCTKTMPSGPSERPQRCVRRSVR